MKLKKLSILSLIITSLSVTGCADFLNNLVSPNVPRPTDLNPVSLKYTNSDLYKYSVFDVDCFPSLGNTKALIIPIWFSDSTQYVKEDKKDQLISDIDLAFNGDPEEIGYESVSSYYKELSKDKFNVTFKISDWYTPFSSSVYYGSSSINTIDTLTTQATEWYFGNTNDSRVNYDYNKDGVLDGVIFIYAAPDYEQLGNDNLGNLWAFVNWHQNTSNRNVSVPIINQYLWASYDFMYSDADARTRLGSNYGSGDTRYCELDTHTYIHEFGHLLGLEDYYDYGPENYTPAGVFSMQDHNIGSHDPFSSLSLGWTKVIVPSETCTVELESFQDSNTVILLTNEYTGSVFDEYLLVELYTPTGLNQFDVAHRYTNKYPSGPALPGIRLWHVDARLAVFENDKGKTYYHGMATAPTGRYGSNTNATYYLATSNTYGGDYGSMLEGIVDNVLDMNILQLIRSDTRINYRPRDYLTYDNLFTTGETFSIEKFKDQFVYKTNLNNGLEFKWSFKVNSVSNSKANITFTLD